MQIYDALLQKLNDQSARIGVIGLGYVGLPLATTFARNGYRVLGVDVDQSKLKALARGESYIQDVPSQLIASLRAEDRFDATSDYAKLRACDVIFICVPTPMTAQKAPDLAFIESATRGIQEQLRAGQLIILQSTTYPGTTDEFVLPLLSATGLQVGQDFFLAFSPERIDPGHTSSAGYDVENTPKVVGGITPACTQLAAALLEHLTANVHVVSSPRAAEMCKLLENTFRSVNIALVNELALLCERMGIDVWEVIDAARTKPYGYMPFYPGAGVGGHCLAENEFLFVKNGHGLLGVRVGDYFADLERQHPTAVRTIAGVTILEPEGIATLSFDLRRRTTCYKPLGALSRRHYRGAMIDVVTEDRRYLRVTADHPMVVWVNDAIQLKRAADLQAGDEFIVPTQWPGVKTEQQTIDLITHMTNDEMNKVRVVPKREQFGDYREQLTSYLKLLDIDPYEVFRSNRMPLRIYLALEQRGVMLIARQDLMLRTGRGPSANSISAVIPINEDFARLVGYYLSEGCITQDESLRTRFTFNANEREYIDDVCQVLDALGLRYSRYKDKQWNSLHIKVSSNLFARLLRDVLNCGVRSTEMQVPGVLLAAPEPIRLALLAGLLRGDGDVDWSQSTRRYYHRGKQKFYEHTINVATVGYFSSSPHLFQQSVALAQGLGFVPTFKKNKPYWRLYGEEQLARLLPLFDGAKRSELESYAKNRRKRMPTKSFTAHGDFATVRIRQVSESTGSFAVYSAEVEDTHTFVTSYGLLTHNCIPVDPYYLSWKAREYDFFTRFIEFAADTNQLMPLHVVQVIAHALNRAGKHVSDSHILVLGVAFKPNIDDARNSPAERVIELLLERKALVAYSDPHVPQFKLGQSVFHKTAISLNSVALDDGALAQCDCAVITTAHRAFDYEQIVRCAPLVVDTTNATRHVKQGREKIVRIGAPM